jgi:hypothetical protein
VALRSILLLDQTVSSVTTISQAKDFNGVTPKRITLLLALTKTSNPGNLTLTVEVSGDKGVNLVTYDKLLTDAGVDAPVSSVVYSATADDVVSLSPEDVLDYIKVSLAAASGTDASNTWGVKCWLVFSY